jgi:hypothetical protein
LVGKPKAKRPIGRRKLDGRLKLKYISEDVKIRTELGQNRVEGEYVW